MVPIMIKIDKNIKTPVYLQLYNQLKEEIITKQRKAHERLPATRTMAQDYQLSRNTVLNAYQQLESEGFLYSKVGSGFYVEEIPRMVVPQPITKQKPIDEHKKQTYACDFRYGSLEPNVYKSRAFRKALKDALYTLENQSFLHDGEAQGLFSLRKAISQHLKEVRGVHAGPKQIIITNGHQYSLKLLSEYFSPADHDLISEDPGHRDTREVFSKAGFIIHPVRVDENGIVTDELINYTHALAYVTPSHQFPLGAILPIGRRVQLLKWAYETGSYIIEDDYDSELRYKEQPVPALFSLDSRDRVIYLGSFSKSLSPDLRVSYIVLPASISLDDETLLSSSASLLIQLTLQKYIESGEYRKRINQIRNVLRKKHNLILDFIDHHYANRIKVFGIGGGSHFLLQIPTEYKEEEIIDLFHKYDVAVYPTSGYYINPNNQTDPMIMIGYSGISLTELPLCLEKLKTGLDAIIRS